MLGDYGVTPYTIPGTSRTYSTSVGTAITVPGEDAFILRSVGWVGAVDAPIKQTGATSARPSLIGSGTIGHAYLDTTINNLVLWSGPVTNHWLSATTGASV